MVMDKEVEGKKSAYNGGENKSVNNGYHKI